MSAIPSDAFGLSIGLDHFFHPSLFDKERLRDTEIHYNAAVRESVAAKDTLIELATALGVTLRDVQASTFDVPGFTYEGTGNAAVRLVLHLPEHLKCAFTVISSTWSNETPDPSIWKECVAVDAGLPAMLSKIYVRHNDPEEFLIPIAYGRRMSLGAMSFFLN